MTKKQRVIFGLLGLIGGLFNTALVPCLTYVINPNPPAGVLAALFLCGVSSVVCSLYLVLEA